MCVCVWGGGGCAINNANGHRSSAPHMRARSAPLAHSFNQKEHTRDKEKGVLLATASRTGLGRRTPSQRIRAAALGSSCCEEFVVLYDVRQWRVN
jgi:hypothetical protein